MPVETRSSDLSVTKHLKARLNSIAAQRRILLLEEEQELEQVKNEYELKRKTLEAEAKRSQVELVQRRREEELELARQRELESGKTKAKGSDGAPAELVKMVGKAVCTRCKDLKIDCYRAPRRNRQASDDAPGVLKNFVRCTTCIDAKQRCRVVIASSTASASARVASEQSKSRLSTTTTASLTIAPSRSASGAAARKKRKGIVQGTPSDEDEDEEESNEDEDSDSPPAAKRHKTKGVTVNPRSKSTGRYLPTIKKPTSSKFVSHSKPKLHPSRSRSSSSQSEVPSDASTSTSNGARAGTLTREATMMSILDTMNRNHETTIKLFTQLIGTSSQTTPQSAPAIVQGDGSVSRVGGNKTRERTPKNKRKAMVKLEDNEVKQHDEVDHLASDNDPEVIVIDDDDDN
ncbi:hypothetical protein EST38_g1535 [Candolleomyces aberdarensis]|uniref:Uncharacterized protein n=1 Tax=Candolleomyces aberdarensis TaxID=2316362 RepID=A0A4Q2DVJ7_9AGAR|nr:hypothetical protein EST38_g1535 [Candolleomyces aberdarensis]